MLKLVSSGARGCGSTPPLASVLPAIHSLGIHSPSSVRLGFLMPFGGSIATVQSAIVWSGLD